MLWYLEHGEHEATVREQMRVNKMPAPKWIEDKPDLHMGMEFYFKAFWELSTCRSVGMAEGPIPWSAMAMYANQYEIVGDEFDRFVLIIKHVDTTYLDYRRKKSDKIGKPKNTPKKLGHKEKKPIGH